MKVHAKFLTSAADPAHFPAPTVPEVAFLGRSNVGKSSLLNSLAGVKLAHVSSTPGRTRTINFFGVQWDPRRAAPELLLVDLPGYGYAKLSREISAEWPKFIEPYLGERQTLALCVLLIDANVPAQASDLQLVNWLKQLQRSFLLVATKTDKLSGNKLRNALAGLQQEFGAERILPYSVTTGAGQKELWQQVRQAADV